MAIGIAALKQLGTAGAAAVRAAKQAPQAETAIARLQQGLKSAQAYVSKLPEGQLRYILGGKQPLAGIASHAEAKTAAVTKLLYAEQGLGGPGAASEFHTTLRDNSGVLGRLIQVAVARKEGLRDASKVDFAKHAPALKQLGKDPQLGSLVQSLSTRFKLGVPFEKLPAPRLPKQAAYQPRSPSYTPTAPDFSQYKATQKELDAARSGFPVGPGGKMGTQMSELYESVPDIIFKRKFAKATEEKAKGWGLKPAMPNPQASSEDIRRTLENAEFMRRIT